MFSNSITRKFFFYHQIFPWINLNHEKTKFSEVVNKNRIVVIGILGLPIIGMLIAAILLIYRKPDNLPIILGVMLFVGIQYIIMMFIFMKRIEQVAKKRIEQPI